MLLLLFSLLQKLKRVVVKLDAWRTPRRMNFIAGNNGAGEQAHGRLRDVDSACKSGQ